MINKKQIKDYFEENKLMVAFTILVFGGLWLSTYLPK